MFALVLALACGGKGGGAPVAAPQTAVKVVTVHPAASSERVALTGTVEAEDSAEIRTEVGGPIASIAFDHGQKVAKGDVLLRLRDAAQWAAVQEGEAKLALAEAQYQRAKSLFERQNASRADLDQADADRALAKATLDKAKEDLRKTVVRAPFDGVVGLREVAPGEVVDPNRVVTRLEAVDRVVVDVAAPERWIPQLQVGLPALVSVEALPGEAFAGEVTFVAPRVDASTRTAGVRVRVPNTVGKLKPGMSASVQLTTAELPDAILLPAQAVVANASGSTVWVVKEGTAEPRPVELGDRTADQVRVVSGLEDGDQVVVEGLIRLRPGAAVRVLDEGGAAGAPTASP